MQVGGAGSLQSKGACAISCASGVCWAPAIKGGMRKSCARGGCWAPAIKGRVHDMVRKWGVLGPCNQRSRTRYRVQVRGAGPLQSKGACPAIGGSVRDIVCKWGVLGPCNQRGRARRARYRVQVGGAGPLQSKGACAISCASGGCWAPAIKGAISCASGGCWAPPIKGGVRDIVRKWGVLGPCNQRGRARYRVQGGGAGPLQSKGACAKSCASGGCWAPAIKGGVRGVRDIVCKWGVLGPCNQRGRDIVCKWGVLGPCNQRGRARYRLQGLARYRLCN